MSIIYFARYGVVPLLCLLLSACGGGGGGGGSADTKQEPGTTVSTAPALSAQAVLGEKIFHDVSLSASGQQSCATCHDATHAHAGADGRAVSLGGIGMNVEGFRNAPSLNYSKFTPNFFFDSESTPTGGMDRDGRAASLSAQARGPFFGAHEMANASVSELMTRLRSASYVAEFTQVFGASIFDNEMAALDRVVFALQQYLKEDPDFRPFDSKFDYYLAGKTTLTEQEQRGLALFNNPNKGNCAGCHPSTSSDDGTPPLFTDFTYDNLGVPRNYAIPANADSSYYDLGLCGPDRTDLVATHSELCGAFKVPTLRNVAITAPYFHNGKFATLREVVSFYVRRDTNPEEWYPLKNDGSGTDKFDDLPPQYRVNVNTTEVPYNRHLGDQPALTSDEIDDVVAFLNTLTDGYKL